LGDIHCKKNKVRSTRKLDSPVNADCNRDVNGVMKGKAGTPGKKSGILKKRIPAHRGTAMHKHC
jgi:hypothetical protein